MARHELVIIQSGRNFPHSGSASSRKSTRVVCEDFICRINLTASTDIRLRAEHRRGERQQKCRFCCTQHLRVRISSHKLSMLVRQHASFDGRACTSRNGNHKVTSFAKLSDQIPHPRRISLLRCPRRPFSSFCGRLISVKHLLSLQSWTTLHHVCPP